MNFAKRVILYSILLFLSSLVVAFTNLAQTTPGTSILEKKKETSPITQTSGTSKASTLQKKRKVKLNRTKRNYASKYRTITGKGNNFLNPSYGAVKSPIPRFLAPEYTDDFLAPLQTDGTNLPNPRLVSTMMHEATSNADSLYVSKLFMQFGQYLDHDLSLIKESTNNGRELDCCDADGENPSCRTVSITADAFFGGEGITCHGFSISEHKIVDETKEFHNSVTSFIDLSTVYGSTESDAKELKLGFRGLLRYSFLHDQEFLPIITNDDRCIGVTSDGSLDCALGGDIRINEQFGLTAMHTIFLREHNRIARRLSHLNSHWSNDRIFYETRTILIGLFQKVVYEEFLPIVIGREVATEFGLDFDTCGFSTKYDPYLNAGTHLVFSTAAFRFGHSLIPTDFKFIDDEGTTVETVPIEDAFHRISIFEDATLKIEDLFRGLFMEPAKAFDRFVVNGVRNLLFLEEGATAGMDLVLLNIMRSRDHGIPKYAKWRKFCQLSEVNTFDDLASLFDTSTITILRGLYASSDDIELFVAALAEKHVNGGLVGETFACLIALQFKLYRFGDSRWFQNIVPKKQFSLLQLNEIQKYSMSRFLCNTMDIKFVTEKPFQIPEEFNNPTYSCKLFPDIDLSLWKESKNIYYNARNFQ